MGLYDPIFYYQKKVHWASPCFPCLRKQYNTQVYKSIQTMKITHSKYMSIKSNISSLNCISLLELALTLLLLNTTSAVLANSADPDQLASEEAN